MTMRSWATIPMPLPSRHRFPIVSTGGPGTSAKAGIPTDSEACGPTTVPSPISMRCSPKIVDGGQVIPTPSPK